MFPAIIMAAILIREVNMHGDATQYKMLEPVVKRAWRVDDVEALPDIMDKAFRLAESGRPGPVLIDMPMDMFSREMEDYLWDRYLQRQPSDHASGAGSGCRQGNRKETG